MNLSCNDQSEDEDFFQPIKDSENYQLLSRIEKYLVAILFVNGEFCRLLYFYCFLHISEILVNSSFFVLCYLIKEGWEQVGGLDWKDWSAWGEKRTF
mgnify:CR=1 FL=1